MCIFGLDKMRRLVVDIICDLYCLFPVPQVSLITMHVCFQDMAKCHDIVWKIP